MNSVENPIGPQHFSRGRNPIEYTRWGWQTPRAPARGGTPCKLWDGKCIYWGIHFPLHVLGDSFPLPMEISFEFFEESHWAPLVF